MQSSNRTHSRKVREVGAAVCQCSSCCVLVEKFCWMDYSRELARLKSGNPNNKTDLELLLNLFEQLIKEKDQVIKEKDEKDQVIKEKDEVIKEKDQEIKEKAQKLEGIQTISQTSLKRLFTDGLPVMRKERSINANANRNHLPATMNVNFAKVFPNGIHKSYQDGTSIFLTNCARQGICYCSESNIRLNVRNVLSDVIAAA